MITEAENRFLVRLYKMYGEWLANHFFEERTGKVAPEHVEIKKEEPPKLNLNDL